MAETKSIRLPKSYRRGIEELVDSKYESGGEAIRTAASKFEPFLGKVPLRYFSEHEGKVTFRDSNDGVIEGFYTKAEEEEVHKAQALRNAIGYELGKHELEEVVEEDEWIEYDFDQMREDLDELEKTVEKMRLDEGDIENLNRVWDDLNGD
ncbi:MAG: hypothetical protein MUP63_01170 [Candidatus Nanohaloarchaeota archaeon QJJ-7]|nr:hypothetical protein [Candidatus Nanohaloarchaeota archaeon QJJ-7]